MRHRLIRAVRRLVGPEPRRRLCSFERRRILSMIDAGVPHRTIVRQHGFTRAEVDGAIRALTGGVTEI
jgi:hypothetical protein